MCEIIAVDRVGKEQRVICRAEAVAAERKRLEQSGFAVVAVIRR